MEFNRLSKIKIVWNQEESPYCSSAFYTESNLTVEVEGVTITSIGCALLLLNLHRFFEQKKNGLAAPLA